MASAAQKTITTAATLVLSSGSSSDSSDVPEGQYLIQNVGSVTCYLGGSDVTTANGKRLQPGEAVSFEATKGEALYAITASSTTTVDYLRLAPTSKLIRH